MRLKKSVGSIVKALSCHPFASGKNAYCESPLLIVLFSPCPLSMTRTPLMQHLQISPYTQSGDTCTNAVLLSHLAKAYSWLAYLTFKKTLSRILFIYVRMTSNSNYKRLHIFGVKTFMNLQLFLSYQCFHGKIYFGRIFL